MWYIVYRNPERVIMIDVLSIDSLRALCSDRSIYWTDHTLKRLRERGIRRESVRQCIMSGIIIEEYPDDYPFPSCLILGRTIDSKPLHVVVGVGNRMIWIVTAYYPNPDEWNEDYSVRRE